MRQNYSYGKKLCVSVFFLLSTTSSILPFFLPFLISWQFKFLNSLVIKSFFIFCKLARKIEDITWPLGDTNFIFECWKRYFQHSKIKFVSPSGHAMFCLFYRYWWNSYIKHNFLNSFSKQQNSKRKRMANHVSNHGDTNILTWDN